MARFGACTLVGAGFVPAGAAAGFMAGAGFFSAAGAGAFAAGVAFMLRCTGLSGFAAEMTAITAPTGASSPASA